MPNNRPNNADEYQRLLNAITDFAMAKMDEYDAQTEASMHGESNAVWYEMLEQSLACETEDLKLMCHKLSLMNIALIETLASIILVNRLSLPSMRS